MQRLRDAESQVRLRTLTRLVEIALEDPRKISPSSFEEMIQRVKDKKTEVRSSALTGLCRVYSKYVAMNLPSLQDASGVAGIFEEGGVIGRDIWERIQGVPSALVGSFGYPDMETRHNVLQLLQEQVLPKAPVEQGGGSESQDNDGQRVTALLALFNNLDEQSRTNLAAIFFHKLRVRKDLVSYLSERSGASKAAAAADEAAQSRVRRSLYKLSETLPPNSDKKTALLDKLLSTKVCISPSYVCKPIDDPQLS